MAGLDRIPPLPGDAEDHARREQGRLRLRLLDGEWFDDLRGHMAQHFDPVRERIVGKPDPSTNLFKSVVEQLSVLYDRQTPMANAENPEAGDDLMRLLGDAGWWSLGTRLQRCVLGLRECFVRPSWTSRGLLLRIVPPTMISAVASGDEPDLPISLREARVRNLGDGDAWYWDQFDLSGDEPAYRVVRCKDGEDVTVLALGREASGANYPFLDESGAPLLPYATYHAERTNMLWNWRTWMEAVEGTLNVAVLQSWWVHGYRDAAWNQKWTLNAAPRGASSTGSGASQSSTIPTDPSSVMQFMSDSDFPAAIGQWAPAVDPLTLGTALHEYAAQQLANFGLTGADAQRRDSASAVSGYAISLRQDAIRREQRRYVPQFERGDLQMIKVVSSLTRAARSAGEDAPEIPESGWRITYPGQPESVEEIDARLMKHERLIDAGLASPVDAYMDLHPGVSREDALVELQRIQAEKRAIG